jgi:hypothetical protein
MKRVFIALTVVIATVSVGAGAAAAQTTTNSTATPDAGNVTAIQLSPTSRLTEWRYQNGTMILRVEAKTPGLVTVVDAGQLAKQLQEGEGRASGSARRQQYRVRRGTNTFRFTATDVDGAAAVTISAAKGSRVHFIRTDAIDTGRPPVKWGTALGLVALAGAGGAVATYRRLIAKLREDEKEVERIL